MDTIKPMIGDLILWNGGSPLTCEVFNVLPDGVVGEHCGNRRFMPHGSYKVVGVIRRRMWPLPYKILQIPEERTSVNWEFPTAR